MPLNLRASKKVKRFDMPVSYRVYEKRDRLSDARNVFTNQDRLDTRFGTSRKNAVALDGPIISLSSFIKTDGTVYNIAKVGTTLVSVSDTGAHTTIKTGLTASTKHRGTTLNNRHIIAIEVDGLFSWDGSTFAPLGQAAPATLTATIASGGALTDTNIYQAAITYYASSVGFETNAQTSSNVTASGANLRVALTDIPTAPENGLIDKIRIYLKNVTNDGEFLFISEQDLGITTFNIDAESTSTQQPPTLNGPPLAGGGKYLSLFNSKLVYSGNNSFKNDVFFSEEYLPDAYNPLDTQTVLSITGQGDVTGLAVGLFSDSSLDPFLVIFKRKSTHIYSEIAGQPKLVPISNQIGCVSHDTIQVKNGVVYFLSEEGWRAISNGIMIKDQQGDAITLGGGDIDDLFKTPGYVYEINRSNITGCFSVYYPTLDQYITWVAEGSNAAYSKAYVYEFETGGFKPYEFAAIATCATLGEDSSGRNIVMYGTNEGYILTHSILEPRSDVDSVGVEVSIPAFAVMPWTPGDDGDFDASYNFRELILRALVSSITLNVKTFLNFDLSDIIKYDYTFTDPNSGFVLDLSRLDEGVFGNERAIVTTRNDINRVGETMAIGFYQDTIGANIGLVAAQLDMSKNGNRN